jgi:branched-chain amino acid transport system permease protein
VVLFMPDGIIPSLSDLLARLRRREDRSIREVSAAELVER